MKTVLIFGASGQVGQALLELALQHPEISDVVAPPRRLLPPHAKLVNPFVDFEALPEDAAWWKTDLTLCALGTTLRQTKSKAGFYRVDHDYVLATAKLVQRTGTSTFGFVSSLGADASSRLFYLKVKGETEKALGTLGFVSLVIARPSLLIGGARASARPLEALGLFLGKHLASLLPRRYQSITTHQVAKSLLEACLAESAGLHVIESEQLQGAR